MSQIIAEYKFDNILYDLIPEFNEGFEYTYEDVLEGNVTTRTIYSDSLPTKIKFGADVYQSASNKSNCLLTVEYLNTDNINNAWGMFNQCTNLSSINSLNLVTSNVIDMMYMFCNCESLTSLDASNWDVSNVTNMHSAFANCRKLVSIGDVSNWNTGNVTDMTYLFNSCQSLTSLNVSNWDTSNVTNMKNIFANCASLITLDLSNWDTSNVTNMSYMICDCYCLTELDLSNLNVENVTDMTYMLKSNKFAKVNLSNWKLNKDVNNENMFIWCDLNNLKEITMNNSDYNSVNKIIEQLPTRNTLGYMYISRNILNNVNISEAESKMWRVLPIGGRVKNVYVNGNNVTNMITKQNKKIKGIYLGNTPLL